MVAYNLHSLDLYVKSQTLHFLTDFDDSLPKVIKMIFRQYVVY